MDRLLLASSLSSVTGIILIYILSSSFDPKIVEISKISGNLMGETVKIYGVVEGVREHADGHVFITLSDGSGKIQVPVFEKVARNLPKMRKGEKLEVTGYVDGYKGNLQVVPRKAADVKLSK
jgi:DNA/RNA endonuclease YhcR with UshA esterase domain